MSNDKSGNPLGRSNDFNVGNVKLYKGKINRNKSLNRQIHNQKEVFQHIFYSK